MELRTVLVSLALLAVGFLAGRLASADEPTVVSPEPLHRATVDVTPATPRLAAGARAVPAEEDLKELRALVGELRGLLAHPSGALAETSTAVETRVVERLERVWTPVLLRAAKRARVDALKEKALTMLEMRRAFLQGVADSNVERGLAPGQYGKLAGHCERTMKRVQAARTAHEIETAMTHPTEGFTPHKVQMLLYDFRPQDWR